ncbi:2-dehydropantoate 2-reductase [Vibrio sp. 404]|uniref:2-dehydropantoate 2-reductase n=1 Tax=Vibrio marinisediminis TaxID=2758441 RepID=A0A7W2FSA8_9VIBR|nr:2-dehydropantoate 2-reductase [Vibrio marinisediminis]MBA5763307.1 2-dehydropantoate 2-reductase [Vibrio marinisediminis]
MNIAIVGPGAIGSLWASYLTEAGHQVNLWSRQPAAKLTIQRDQYAQQSLLNNNTQALQQSDVILVTLKAPSVLTVLSAIAKHIDQDSIIVLMHNGMGTAEGVNALLPNNPLLLATTTHGAYRPSMTQVLHTGYGQTLLGAANSQGELCQFLVDVFNHALSDVTWHSNINQALWTKLAINCAINPLTAIHQVTNGELVQPHYQQQLQNIVNEVSLVMNAEGFEIDVNHLLQTVNNVIHATSNNYSSMEQDIAHQRRSEIDFITGYLLESASRHNIDAPYNQALYQAVKKIEQSW